MEIKMKTLQDYRNNVEIPWSGIEIDNIDDILNDVFNFAVLESLSYAVTRSILIHVIAAYKNKQTTINSLRDINIVRNKEHFSFAGIITNNHIELQKYITRG